MATLPVAIDARGATLGAAQFQASGAQVRTTARSIIGALTPIGAAMTAAFGARHIIQAVSEQERTIAQLRAGLRGVGRESGQTLEGMRRFAAQMQTTTRYSNEQVEAAQAMLLSFRNISGEAFPRAIRAAGDLAERMGTDLRNTVLQVAKALDDPVRGLTALRRSGTIFTEEQQNLIQSLVETNQHAEAQNIILRELEAQYGGSAEAARRTFAGSIDVLKNSFDDLVKNVGSLIALPLVPLFEVMNWALSGLNIILEEVVSGLRWFVDWLFNTTDATSEMSNAALAAERRLEAQRQAAEREAAAERERAAAIAAAARAEREALQPTLDRVRAFQTQNELLRLQSPLADELVDAWNEAGLSLANLEEHLYALEVLGEADPIERSAAAIRAFSEGNETLLEIIRRYEGRLPQLVHRIATWEGASRAQADALLELTERFAEHERLLERRRVVEMFRELEQAIENAQRPLESFTGEVVGLAYMQARAAGATERQAEEIYRLSLQLERANREQEARIGLLRMLSGYGSEIQRMNDMLDSLNQAWRDSAEPMRTTIGYGIEGYNTFMLLTDNTHEYNRALALLLDTTPEVAEQLRYLAQTGSYSVETLAREADLYEEALELTRELSRAEEHRAEVRDALNELLARGVITETEYERALERMRAANEEAAESMQSLWERTRDSIATSIGRALEQVIIEGRSASEVMRALAVDISRALFRAAVIQPLTEWVGGIGSARGNVFGTRERMQRGGIVRGPTTLPMPGGRAAFIEGPPEAVMPLERTADGRLGVVAAGGGEVNVVMNITTPDAASFRASEQQIIQQYRESLSRR